MKTGNYNSKLDNIPFGILVGLVLALLSSYLIFSIKNTTSLAIFESKYIVSLYMPYIQLGAIANLIPFFVFNHFDMINAQRGVIFSTIILFVLVAATKFLL